MKSMLTYETLNRLRLDQNLLVGLIWIPDKHAALVYDRLKNSDKPRHVQIQKIPEHNLIPPTYFNINEFVWPFHEIVVTYGIPSYKEINPTTFNIVTFPFLFGIMFGDIGHGLILFLFAAYLCLKSDHILKSYPSLLLFLKVRYLLLLMGLFATYCGLIYNDLMSMPLNIFGSCYDNVGLNDVKLKADCVYPVGVDPKWYVSKNELNFMNSMKMKIAVIFGILQMSLGICLKGMNHLYFKQYMEFFFEFIPQLLFLLALFGYMDLMIIVKWVKDYTHKEYMAPSVI